MTGRKRWKNTGKGREDTGREGRERERERERVFNARLSADVVAGRGSFGYENIKKY